MANSLGGTYSTGLATLDAGGKVAIGLGTAWSLVAEEGDWLFANGHIGIISSVDDDTHLTLEMGWTGGDLTDAPYRIVKMSWLRSVVFCASTQATSSSAMPSAVIFSWRNMSVSAFLAVRSSGYSVGSTFGRIFGEAPPDRHEVVAALGASPRDAVAWPRRPPRACRAACAAAGGARCARRRSSRPARCAGRTRTAGSRRRSSDC